MPHLDTFIIQNASPLYFCHPKYLTSCNVTGSFWWAYLLFSVVLSQRHCPLSPVLFLAKFNCPLLCSLPRPLKSPIDNKRSNHKTSILTTSLHWKNGKHLPIPSWWQQEHCIIPRWTVQAMGKKENGPLLSPPCSNAWGKSETDWLNNHQRCNVSSLCSISRWQRS